MTSQFFRRIYYEMYTERHQRRNKKPFHGLMMVVVTFGTINLHDRTNHEVPVLPPLIILSWSETQISDELLRGEALFKKRRETGGEHVPRTWSKCVTSSSVPVDEALSV